MYRSCGSRCSSANLSTLPTGSRGRTSTSKLLPPGYEPPLGLSLHTHTMDQQITTSNMCQQGQMSIQSHVRNSADSKGSRNSVTTALFSKTKRKPSFTESLLEDQETTVQSRAAALLSRELPVAQGHKRHPLQWWRCRPRPHLLTDKPHTQLIHTPVSGEHGHPRRSRKDPGQAGDSDHPVMPQHPHQSYNLSKRFSELQVYINAKQCK